MQDCKTLNAKVQVVAWLSTSTQLVSAFLELWMFVDVFMSLETPFFSWCVFRQKTKRNLKAVRGKMIQPEWKSHVVSGMLYSWAKKPECDNAKNNLEKLEILQKSLYSLGKWKSWCIDNWLSAVETDSADNWWRTVIAEATACCLCHLWRLSAHLCMHTGLLGEFYQEHMYLSY